MNGWVHMSGAGNTFLVGTPECAKESCLVTDNASDVVPALLRQHTRTDKQAIEGLMVVDVQEHSFTCDYYNPDGSYGMLCGNGARCAVRYALDHGLISQSTPFSFQLNGKVYHAALPADPSVDNGITIVLPPPTSEQLYTEGSLRGIPCSVYYVLVPGDHVVISMPSGEMKSLVTSLRHHEVFPRGVNVNMVHVESGGVVNIATYERGVEAITGACGTGAVAASVALWRQGLTTDFVRLRPPSGRFLEVTIHHQDATITSIDLRGDAHYDS